MFLNGGMKMINYADANKIQDVCLNHYSRVLSKSGKAKLGSEWTVLSAIVMLRESDYEVVSMGTGTKCIGHKHMCSRGLVVNDSHAEVVARRSFLCFLYDQIEKSLLGVSSVFDLIGGKCEMKHGISFHFFTTHVPCGDASIIEKYIEKNGNFSENIGFSVNSPMMTTKRPNEDDLAGPRKLLKSDNGDVVSSYCDLGQSKENIKGDGMAIQQQSDSGICRTDDNLSETKALDVHRTGAKCVSAEDPLLDGLEYHVLGVLRTKPGRGDRTLSLSCSDKICKWNVLGIQGALIMHFLKAPIYLESITIASEVFCEKAFHRATQEKISNLQFFHSCFKPHRPQLFHISENQFEGRRRQNLEQNPSASSICWFASENSNNKEVIVRGQLLGLTKKCKQSNKSCFISKASLFKKFHHLKNLYLDVCTDSSLNDQTLMTYLDYKMASSEYQKAWEIVKQSSLAGWISANEKFNQF